MIGTLVLVKSRAPYPKSSNVFSSNRGIGDSGQSGAGCDLGESRARSISDAFVANPDFMLPKHCTWTENLSKFAFSSSCCSYSVMVARQMLLNQSSKCLLLLFFLRINTDTLDTFLYKVFKISTLAGNINSIVGLRTTSTYSTGAWLIQLSTLSGYPSVCILLRLMLKGIRNRSCLE